MILLDAYALVAFLAEERAADEVEEVLRRGGCAISVVNLAEAVDVCGRVHGLPLAQARHVIELLASTDHLELVTPSVAVVWRAAELRRRNYRARTSALSLADCFLLATAEQGDEIATSDGPVLSVARDEGFDVIALPDSDGNRP